MAGILLKALSGRPGASEVTLMNGDTVTGYRQAIEGNDYGNVAWDKVYSGQRGTQGARLVGADPQNRLVTFPLQVQGTSQDDLEAKLSVIWTLADEFRRYGGKVTWRPNGGSFRQYFDVLDGGAQIDSFGRTFHWNNLVYITLGIVCGPYLKWDDYDIFEDWSTDTISGGYYTFDSGAAGNVAVSGGQLTSTGLNLTTENRLIHTDRGYTYGDTQATLKGVPGNVGAGFRFGVILKRVDANNYLIVYIDDNITNSRLRLDKVVAGTPTNLSSTNLGSRVANGVPFWVRGRIEANVVYLEYFTTAPTAMATPTTSNSYILTAAETSQFGAGAMGASGVSWVPSDAGAVLDDFAVEPFTYRNVTLPADASLRLNGKIPGDARALGEAVVTPSGGAAVPIWALLGWVERPSIYNYVWDGDFENSSLSAAHWSVAAVTNINGAATSKTRITGGTLPAKFGAWMLSIAAPATADTGASFRIFRRFKKGVAYTAEAWIAAATATTNTYIRLGNGAANDKASSGNTALSSTWQRITVSWVPTADYDDAHVTVNIAAATATTYLLDGVMVYEGTVAPTSKNQIEGRGGFPPFGILEAENDNATAVSAGAAYRSGFETTSASNTAVGPVIDPGLLAPDDYTQNEIALEVWGRVEYAGASPPTLTLQGRPISATTVPYRYSEEFRSGKVLAAATGTVIRFVRLGTLRLPTNLGRWQLAVGIGTNAAAIDYLLVVPSRFRALGPTGKANDANYPLFVPATTELTKRIRSDLSATLAEPVAGSPEADTHGLGGSLLELPPGNVDACLKLSSLVPDDPTSGTTTEQLAHSATVHFAITPRSHLGRSS